MRTFVRIVISVVVGFLLMWQLGIAFDYLWGLMHGGFLVAWPALSILTFLALGYLPPFSHRRSSP